MKSSTVYLSCLFNLSFVFTFVVAVCEFEPDGSYVAHYSSRHMFFYCWEGSAYEGECYPGQEFDPFYRVCTDIRDEWDLPSCNRVPNGSIIPDPSSDRSFYICFNGLANRVSCPENEIFNPETFTCAPLRNQPTRPTTLSGSTLATRTPLPSTSFNPDDYYDYTDYPEVPSRPPVSTTRRPPVTTTRRTTTRSQPTRTTTRAQQTRTTTRNQQTRTTSRGQQTRTTTRGQPTRTTRGQQ